MTTVAPHHTWRPATSDEIHRIARMHTPNTPGTCALCERRPYRWRIPVLPTATDYTDQHGNPVSVVTGHWIAACHLCKRDVYTGHYGAIADRHGEQGDELTWHVWSVAVYRIEGAARRIATV